MAEPNDLETFRAEWKKELQHHESLHKNSDIKEDKDYHIAESGYAHMSLSNELVSNILNEDNTSQDSIQSSDHVVGSGSNSSINDSSEYYPFKILTHFLNEAPKRQKPKNQRIHDRPTGETWTKRKYFSCESSYDALKKKKESDKDESSKQEESKQQRNLDIFIADLDEINEIPFFDSTIPREVAMKIFQHLDIKSLCSCSQVSRSWKSLADDELLWCRICQRLGYDNDLHVSEGQGWKVRVQHYIEEKRLLNANWKARIGKPYNLHFARGGVLCAVHSFGSAIVAGYTNCSVRSWDSKSGDICTYNASDTALVLDDSADEDLGRIHNEIKHVVTTAHITAASFRHGFVDIWRKEGSTDPIHTCTFHRPDISSLCACDIDSNSSLVAASQGTRVQICSIVKDEGKCSNDFDMSTAVTRLDWLNTCQSSDHLQLFITCHSSVHMKTLYTSPSHTFARGDESITEVHNIIWAPITSIGIRGCTHEMAVGFNFYSGPSPQIKVNIYDLSKNQLKSTLTGHTWIVSCIFLPDSLTHQLATGSGDRKIRLYDLRVGSSAVTTLAGHVAKITSVQMDDWKIVSGDEGGFVNVWDQRMCRKLWDVHNRHPVQYCHFDDRLLIIGNVPYLKFPIADEFECVSSLRYRGTLQVYDFLANQQTQGIPDICLSSYNEPEAYDYNIGLLVPYDTVS